jgi:hypothetical protein
MYQIIPLGSPYLLDELKKELDVTKFKFVSETEDVITEQPALYLYYGVSDADATYKNLLNLKDLVYNLCILPIVKDTNQFKNVIPAELSSINAMQVETKGDIKKLRNYILCYFGLLNVNRKIFISYKRSDTETLAVQLYHALVDAGFNPFLDTRSIGTGVPFQEYLKHELSDSEIMLFLNSPNFILSKYTMEELNMASKLGVGIVQLKFKKSKTFQEAAISKVIEIEGCFNSHVAYNDQLIKNIVSAIEKFRAEAFEQKRRTLIQEIRKSMPDLFFNENFFLCSKDGNQAILPLTRYPNSIDIENLEGKNIGLPYKGTGVKKIIYNGIYCRHDIKRNIEWLNSKCTAVQAENITK